MDTTKRMETRPRLGEPPHGWQLWIEDEAKKKSWFGRHKVLTTLSAVIAFFIVIGVLTNLAGSNDEATAGTSAKAETTATAKQTSKDVKSKTSPSKAPKAKKQQRPGLNTKVTDGDFQFTVKGLECGKTQVGDDTFGEKAQGEFCFVTLVVKNVGNKAGTFFGSNQKLFNDKGQEFSVDTEAAIYVKDSKSFLEDINPGNSLTGQIIFDVPKKTKPASLELHASLFSKGVTIDLK